MANARARRNFLSKIRVNGVNLSSLEDIKEGVCRAYQSLISNSGDWRPSINDLNFKELGEDLASSLEVMFSEEEIFAALNFGSVQGVLHPWDLPKKLKLHVPLAHSQEGRTEDLRNFKPISLIKDNTLGLLLKMDIEKAFDSIGTFSWM
ncbi:hypothetical protein CK203_032113 [Vitis vinifera]|uniref:Reverse transcriptase domain-containing protein n=1 Tax=Vitis vinifera TaxID=29760 RepID=A0A438IPI0_VITVI|nr:hypothetical protein CK203_032113 [Vitis vinifera]